MCEVFLVRSGILGVFSSPSAFEASLGSEVFATFAKFSRNQELIWEFLFCEYKDERKQSFLTQPATESVGSKWPRPTPCQSPNAYLHMPP